MLALTDDAVEVVKQIVAIDGPAEAAGLRMVAEQGGAQPRFQLSVAAMPGEGDEVVETQGARVFLAPRAASLLDDKLLDASVEQNEVSFTIVDQPELWPQRPGRGAVASDRRALPSAPRSPPIGAAAGS